MFSSSSVIASVDNTYKKTSTPWSSFSVTIFILESNDFEVNGLILVEVIFIPSKPAKGGVFRLCYKKIKNRW